MKIHKIIVSDRTEAGKIAAALAVLSNCSYTLERSTAFEFVITANPRPDSLVDLLYSLQLQENIWLVSNMGYRRTPVEL